MEEILKKIASQLSKKEIEHYEIISKVDKNGNLKLVLNEPQIFKEDCDYILSLLRLETSAFFPNITEENNMFYYSPDKELKFQTGAYDIEDINKYIQNFIPDENIKIDLNKSSGHVLIKLKNGYKIDFTKNKTFRKMLGFDANILDKPLNISENICNVISSQKIFITCDIIKGSYLNDKRSSILYSFSNNYQYGELISLKLSDKESHLLREKRFQIINFSFMDDEGKPIDFQGNSVNMTIRIQEI